MSSHPDNIGPNRCSRASYEERISHQGYPRHQGQAQPSAKAIQRAIAKLGMVAIPKYPTTFHVKNSEIIPIQP